ncbi:MAG: GspH/FimT family pseudopilin [Solirubrobacterales bacterium]
MERNRGFSTIEAVMVLLIVAVVVGSLIPTLHRQLTHARINRGANTIASDLLQAQSLAARQHAPVTVRFDSTAKSVVITRTVQADTLVRRYYGAGGDFNFQTFTPSVSSAIVFPNGMVSTAVTITISGESLTRTITMSRAGQVRIN